MSVLLAISPLLVVTIGALLLMLTEAFGKPASPEGFGPGGLVVDAGAELDLAFQAARERAAAAHMRLPSFYMAALRDLPPAPGRHLQAG